VSEVFSTPSDLWAPSLQAVIAHYASNVRHWQLGGDHDSSFVGLPRLPETLGTVKRELDRIGGDAFVGIPWDARTPLPPEANMPPTFLSLADGSFPAGPQPNETFVSTRRSRIPQWALIQPLPKSKFTPAQQAADLVKRMVAAKIAGAEAIFADNVFDAETGLLDADGSPTRLFLPWRTTAVALRHAEFLGSLALPGGSSNYAFARDGQVVLVVWNDRPGPIEEDVYLGDNVVVTDVWGRAFDVESGPRGQRLEVGSLPLFVHGSSAPIARWQMAVKFQSGQAQSAYEAHRDAIIGKNTFPQGVSGTVTIVPPRDWEIDPRTWSINAAAGEEFRQDLSLRLPPHASLGFAPMAIDFDIVADRRYQFRVYQRYRVGLGDVAVAVVDRRLPDGRLEIEQTISNNIAPAEMLNFRCTLFVPGRKHHTLTVTKLARGEDKKLYVLTDADALAGEELWLRAEQIGGRRVLNYRWRVGENWANP
jgi:hypothetical protein